MLLAAIAAPALAIVAITEIHRAPDVGKKTGIPGGASHSFVEITNFGSDTFHFKNIFLTNGRATDSIRLFDSAIAKWHPACSTKTAYLPPGGIAVILPQNYIAGLAKEPATVHPVADGTFLLTVNRKNLCGGLASDDGFALLQGPDLMEDNIIDLAADPWLYATGLFSGMNAPGRKPPEKIYLSGKQTKGVSFVPATIFLSDRSYAASTDEKLTPGRYGSLQDGVLIEYAPIWDNEDYDYVAVNCSFAVAFVAADGNGATWRLYSRSSSGAVTGVLGNGSFEEPWLNKLERKMETKPRNYVFEVTRRNGRTVSIPVDLSGFWATVGVLRITEIYPRGGSAAAGQPEWFELQNTSSADINLMGWSFGVGNAAVTLAEAKTILSPGQFIVVTKDSSELRARYKRIPRMIQPGHWSALNNSDDTIGVFPPNYPHTAAADVAIYHNARLGGGWTTQSLERVTDNGRDSASWALCPDPTPGFPGNAGLWRAVSTPSMEIGPTPFRPNGKGTDGYLSIKLKAPPNSRIKVKILAFNGKTLKTFNDEKELIMWDGATDSSHPAPPGPIYVVAEFTTNGKRVSIRKNGVLWR
jgi:hypothetical protein